MNQPDVIHFDVPATHQYLNVIGVCLEALVSRMSNVSEPKVVAYAVQLAAQEICANIVDHAYVGRPDGRIALTITVDTQPQRITLEIVDTGTTFDPADVAEPNLDDVQVRGYGLFLVNELMDKVVYEPLPDHNRWRLVKHIT